MKNSLRIAITIVTFLLNLIALSSNAQAPSAAFNTNQTAGCIPLVIQFTNTSVNGSTYFWDFGNGNVSILANPSNVYITSGTYTVKLIATSATGQKDSVISSNLITVVSDSIAGFYATNTVSCLDGNSFSFINTSLNSTNCLWDFGDGNTSTLQNPTHSYSSQGIYTVKLIAYNSYGCSDIRIKVNYIEVLPKPVAAFSSNGTIACSVSHVFNFTSTTPFVNSWLWDFGDGHVSTLANPQHTYNATGTYTVSLIASNTSGCADTLIKNNYISIVPNQIPSFTASTTNTCTQSPVLFTNTSANSVSWLWNFGDSGTSTQQHPSHSYQNSGNFTVSLTITTNSNCSYTTTTTNYINVQANAVSNFTLNNSTGCAPLNVQFSNVSTNDVSRVWEFGDGISSTLENPSHTYTTNGSYTVKLHSFNTFGCESVLQQTNAIMLSAPLANFSANLNPGCAPLFASFTNSSTNASLWYWDFGDGTSSTLQSPVHTYNFPGDYDVSLIASNSQGCSDTLIRASYVHVINTVADYTTPPAVTGCVPFNTTFENETYGAVSWLWSFGDGNTSTLQNPSHTFITSGSYTVSLIIQLNGGCTQIYSNFRTFNLEGVDAQFSYTQSECPPYIVNFTDTTSENSSSCFWDFGNGLTSTQKNPIQGYLNSGYYTVVHSITTPSGCTSEVIESNLIHFSSCSSAADSSGVSVPGGGGDGSDTIPENNLPPISSCAPVLIHFHNVFPGASSWFWNFGDGTTSILENPIHNYITDGIFDVTLITRDSSGAYDTIIYNNYIHSSGINTNFSFTQNNNCLTTSFAFTGISQNAISWFWNFGDGSTSIQQNPGHTYSDSITNYTITLTTVNTDGCAGSKSNSVFNSNDNPVVWANNTTVCSNQSISFYCSSANFVGYYWDFGDGTNSSLQNPTHSYQSGGVFQVTLALTSINGCVHNFSLQNSILVNNPVADFTTALVNGCNSQTVNFSNLSSGVSLPLSSHCKWDFGDSSPSLWAENPSHTYSAPGTYHVTLLVNYNSSCSGTIIKTVTIFPTVIADFSSTQNTTCFPITSTYNNSSTPASSWLWNFGDGTTSVLQNPIHVFSATPSAGVSLTITDGSGCQATKIKSNIAIFNTSFSVSVSSGCAPLNVVFTDSSLIANAWFWDFGDGTTSLLQNPVHDYLNNGTFQVILISKTITGCIDTMVFNSINVMKPIANFISSNPTNCAPTMASFNDISIGATSWLWDFGDGSSSVNQNVGHIYNIPGLYTINLVVTDSLGCSDTLLRTNYVNIHGSIANFVTSTNQYCSQALIQFADSSINASGWNWNFGDGNTSSQQNPSNSYQSSAQYTISLIVQDSFGCSSNFILPNPVVINPLPISNFSVSDTVFCAPFSVSFFNNSQNAASYLWNFGDGSTSSLPNPSHVFSTSGTYTISLIATNQFGCSDTSKCNPIIANIQPEMDFTVNASAGCSPLNVSFSTSTELISNASYFWNFGNDTTSTEQNPSTAFTNPGFYSVSLIVTNHIGCSDTIIKSSFVEVYDFNPPVASGILCVTVTSDNSTYLVWNPSTATDFAYYKIYRKDIATGNYLPLGIINNSSVVSFTDTNLNTLKNSYCYKVQTYDNCGFALSLDSLQGHCTMDVTAIGLYDDNSVNWTSYVGATVGSYSIYRMEIATTNTVLIGTVQSTVLSIIDTNLYCPLDFSYRIKANNLNGNFISSSSDTSIARPAYSDLAHQQIDVVRSTVINNAEVLTEWNTPVIAPEKITGYAIYKSIDNINFSFLTQVNSLTHEFIDSDVEANEKNYYYKIEAENSCNISTLGSNRSSSILLQGELSNGSVLLSWTKYEGWSMGVDYYKIEKMNDAGKWEIIKTVDGAQLNYQGE